MEFGHEGWLGGDIALNHTGPVAAYDTNFRIIRRMVKFLEKIGPDEIAEIPVKDGDIAETYNFPSEQLMPE